MLHFLSNTGKQSTFWPTIGIRSLSIDPFFAFNWSTPHSATEHAFWWMSAGFAKFIIKAH